MAATFNKTIVVGNLTRDPTTREVKEGTSVTGIGLAINDSYTSKSGEKIESTVFLDVDAWGKLGENCAKFLRKGASILVEGKIQQSSWVDNGGNNRSKLSLRATNVQFLQKRTGEDPGAGIGTKGAQELPTPAFSDDLPF